MSVFLWRSVNGAPVSLVAGLRLTSGRLLNAAARERVRTFLIMLCEGLVLFCACLFPASAQMNTTAAPPTWEPTYWEQMMLAVKSARERGDKLEAEGLCARAIPYVEAQAVKALRDYAELLDSQEAGSGADTRAKAERLAQIKAEQTRATKPGSGYLGFVPWDELNGYAGILHQAKRESDSQAARALAAAYKYTQEVYVRRTLLMREGKDPRGEC